MSWQMTMLIFWIEYCNIDYSLVLAILCFLAVLISEVENKFFFLLFQMPNSHCFESNIQNINFVLINFHKMH